MQQPLFEVPANYFRNGNAAILQDHIAATNPNPGARGETRAEVSTVSDNSFLRLKFLNGTLNSDLV